MRPERMLRIRTVCGDEEGPRGEQSESRVSNSVFLHERSGLTDSTHGEAVAMATALNKTSWRIRPYRPLEHMHPQWILQSIVPH